jgi:hypothetical protein
LLYDAGQWLPLLVCFTKVSGSIGGRVTIFINAIVVVLRLVRQMWGWCSTTALLPDSFQLLTSK